MFGMECNKFEFRVGNTWQRELVAVKTVPLHSNKGTLTSSLRGSRSPDVSASCCRLSLSAFTTLISSSRVEEDGVTAMSAYRSSDA